MSTSTEPFELRARLINGFTWRYDSRNAASFADMTGWWRDPGLLTLLGHALAEQFREDRPTVVVGVESSGLMLGPLVATSLDVGFVAIRKDHDPSSDNDEWLQRTTPPDYDDCHLRLGVRRTLISPGDRVLAVDDWVATGGQLLGVRKLIEDAHASWLGAAVVADALTDNGVRRHLTVRALVHERDLG